MRGGNDPTCGFCAVKLYMIKAAEMNRPSGVSSLVFSAEHIRSQGGFLWFLQQPRYVFYAQKP